MRRTISFAAAVILSVTVAGAQNMYDAINFSRNDYIGTARSMALGNAVTAIGGDLGTIGINPAGSAVAGYGQLVITPGLTVSSVSSAYSPVGDTRYGAFNNTAKSRLSLPNLGISMVMNTGRSSGLKSVTFAVVSNQTVQYNYDARAYGSNSYTSKIGEFAASARGIDEGVLANYNSYQNSYVSWDLLTAYQGGMFSSYGEDGDYVGVSEALDPDGTYHYVPGELSQSSQVTKVGYKNDLVFNFGANISDRFFVGFNLGTPTAQYRYSEGFYETAADPEMFPVSFVVNDRQDVTTYFSNSAYNYSYTADIDGIYAKFGIIATPVTGLRIGAAIQTPTAYTITERWQYGASTSFVNSSYNDSQTSPRGEYTYCLKSPYVANFGVAFTFGAFGFISADYELTDYSVMRFSELYSSYSDYMAGDTFRDINETNRNFAGVSHSLRIGGELKLTPLFALRAGVSVLTSPERHWTNSEGADVTANEYLSDFDAYNSYSKRLVSASYYKDRTTSFSFGVGYSSPGSFFADLGVKLTKYPEATFSPYYDYDNYDASGAIVSVQSPRILNRPNLWIAALTFGWRF